MARKMSSTLQVLVVSCCSLLLLCAPAASAGDYPPTAKGLSYGFYQRSCPKAETIVRSFLKKAIRNDVDATMDARFAAHLRLSCPAKNTTNTTAIDVRTPNAFDNKYYVDLLSRQGLLTSDQVLFSDGRTRGLVGRFAVDQPEFFRRFAFSMVKMSQIQVMTGVQGEIRTNCSVRNAAGGGT
ncbi:hypothetical protein OsJ_04859 [Oryza sativa Japonica Group]|uniref:Plant heme peroxidase family profile domain-containing protein n=1 Tax=Oryza sativa subsp. japonica TaxID=39947 RepID=B9EWL2_ORYSJ|nr:hypothetical protein OsJ_04859 [Oryza sativa Japonica Group]